MRTNSRIINRILIAASATALLTLSGCYQNYSCDDFYSLTYEQQNEILEKHPAVRECEDQASASGIVVDS